MILIIVFVTVGGLGMSKSSRLTCLYLGDVEINSVGATGCWTFSFRHISVYFVFYASLLFTCRFVYGMIIIATHHHKL